LYETALAQIQAKLPSLDLPTMVDKIWEKISSSVSSDPRKPYSFEEAVTAKNQTKEFMNARYTELVGHNGNRKSSSLSVVYPKDGFTLQGTIKPKLSITGDGVLSFKRVEGHNICQVNSVTGAVLIQGAGLCRVAASITQTDSYHSAMTTLKIAIPKLASRILVEPYGTLRNSRSFTISATTESTGSLTAKLKSGPCKVTRKTVKALAGSGKCLITLSVAGDATYFGATKTISISLRR
ncbi:MAG: hypothetical protein RIS26_592, partial [Actinomycetota bacterium]